MTISLLNIFRRFFPLKDTWKGRHQEIEVIDVSNVSLIMIITRWLLKSFVELLSSSRFSSRFSGSSHSDFFSRSFGFLDRLDCRRGSFTPVQLRVTVLKNEVVKVLSVLQCLLCPRVLEDTEGLQCSRERQDSTVYGFYFWEGYEKESFRDTRSIKPTFSSVYVVTYMAPNSWFWEEF